ncbi:hypothetical protein [Acrocarpospora catenulata]|uniref:hypothetical protein n=1 Tax=Acrocarpospora catenulata TaxID=2836182 RepID=UPI001BDAE41B|nr:hypothetical protein [Acrocarpospora catenulata]
MFDIGLLFNPRTGPSGAPYGGRQAPNAASSEDAWSAAGSAHLAHSFARKRAEATP